MEVTRIEPVERSGRSEDRLGVLYEMHAAATTRLAYVLTGDRQAAEDLTQEAFVRVGRKLFGLRDPEHARNYLFRTIINLSRDRLRRLKSERNAVQRTSFSLSHETMPDVSEQDQMWNALRKLPGRQRAALFLRYYQDLSEAQTADALQCSVSAVKSLVNRGLRDLRGNLEGETP